MKVFLDTNIILDLLVPGRPCCDTSATIMHQLLSYRHEIVITTQSVIDAYYSSQRYHISKGDIDFLIEWLMNKTNIRYIDIFSLRFALRVGHPDFEDSAQISCAENEGCDIFLTSDAGILARGIETMLVLTPAQFLERMK